MSIEYANPSNCLGEESFGYSMGVFADDSPAIMGACPTALAR
jgi:hypothetical protein